MSESSCPRHRPIHRNRTRRCRCLAPARADVTGGAGNPGRGYTLWAAQDIILPVLLAMFFALVGNPILRLLQKLWIPRALGALLILGAGLGVTGSLAVQLIGPAMEWAQEAPQQLRKVARQVQNLTAGAAGQPGRGELRARGRR